MQYLTDEHYEIGLKNGIKRQTIYRRVYQYGWDIEKAITTSPISREERTRKYPKKYTDLALANGLNIVTFYSRVRRGWSYEDACSVKQLSNTKTGWKEYCK